MSAIPRAVTVLLQTLAEGKVVACAVRPSVLRVYKRKDGTEYVRINGRRCDVIKGVALSTR